MKENINIAEILKDKKYGIRLYSPIFGKCTFCCVREDINDICVKKHNGVKEFFDSKGLYYNTGEVMLFPSKSMRDWEKLSWKRGDVLVSKDGNAHVIFEGFDDDTYETFNGNNYLWKNEGITMCFGEYEDELPTSDFSKANQEDAQKYIHQIEKRLGYKLNFETLKIEKQPEFKDGDIVALVVRKCTHIAIFQSRQEAYIGFHAVLCQNDELLLEEPFREDVGDIELRLATDSEKKQLFSALEKEGKAWDAEKRQIVDLKQKWTPNPFDRVITRNDDDDIWTANIFSHMDSHGEYVTIGCVGGYTYCIPYNEDTAKLIGTTNNVDDLLPKKGGEQ